MQINRCMYSRNITITILIFFLGALIFLQCMQSGSLTNDMRGKEFAGYSQCIDCHKDIFHDYTHNNHYKTSTFTSSQTISPIITRENNTVTFINDQSVVVEHKDSLFYQTWYKAGKMIESKTMDIAFGSGRHAQTFGFLNNRQWYELPLTYLTNLGIWTNSPGFPINEPYFTRIIPSRCFECHASYVSVIKEKTGPLQLEEKFNKNAMILGIDCERCHGPAAQHVQFHRQHPDEKLAHNIVPIKSLNRKQQLDLCATCHSGNPVSMRSIFTFTPGDTLSNFYLYYPGAKNSPDVHGMQLQALELSKCFQQSTLTCLTCHQSHSGKSNSTNFTATCFSCHNTTPHAIAMNKENKGCISCHMPLSSSKSLDFNNGTSGKNIPYLLHNHRIAIYPAILQDKNTGASGKEPKP